MRKIMLLVFLAFASIPAFSQQGERVYLSTDRDWYAAGETVYLSAFCVKTQDEMAALSSVSAVAYAELASADGMAAGAKIALKEGRGAGTLILPRNLPTGNYSLCAYTSMSKEEVLCSKVISIYNTTSTARVSDGIVQGNLPQNPGTPASGLISLQEERGTARLVAETDANVSISVFRKEPFPSYNHNWIASIMGPADATSAQTKIPEYDGEILTLRLTGADGNPLRETGIPVLISRPGHKEDIYASVLQPDGTACFYTDNLFGKGDLVVTLDKPVSPFKVETVSPFMHIIPKSVPELILNPSLSKALVTLNARMQLTSAFDADTLYTHLPVRDIPFLPGEHIIYRLDDYTRFATFQEVFVEYLSDIRAKGKDESLQLRVRSRERTRGMLSFRENPSLIMIDCVPVLQHNLVYYLDPALVKSVDVYPRNIALGGQVYSGVANFITFKGDMGGIRFGDNVKILDYDGVSYPVAFGPVQDDRYPNQRETLLWQPIVNLKAGEPLELPSFDVPEGYVLVVEGLTHDGTPLYFREAF